MTAHRPRLSLLKLLTLPFLAVILLLALIVGVLSYRAAVGAVDDAARAALSASVQRIGDGLERQRSDADAVLLAAFPDAAAPPADLGAGLDDWVRRLWGALALHESRVAELRFARADGQAVALRRLSSSDAQLTLRREPTAVPEVVQIRVTSGPMLLLPSSGSPRGDDSALDWRESAWYRSGQGSPSAQWMPAAADLASHGLSRSRVRRVSGGDGRPIGVAAVEIALKPVEDLLRDLTLSPRAVAFVVDGAGQLIAQRGAPVVLRVADGGVQWLSVHDSPLPAVAAVYARLLPQLVHGTLQRPGFLRVELPGSEAMLASYARVGGVGGPPWAVVVAAPRGDFAGGMLTNAAHTAAAALVAAAIVLLAGAWVRRRIARDAAELVHTTQRMSDGDFETPPGPMVTPELEALRDGLRRMQLRLRTDRVTGLANREAVLTRLHDRMRPGRRLNDAPLLALLFVDLDRFKAVNDRHGHETGDFVLQTIGRRLRQTVRDTDLVSRWSGDEFVLLLDGVSSPENAQRVRDQVERVLRDPVELGPGRDAVELDGTVGLALSVGDTREPEALIRAAEHDMAQRKPSSLSQW